MARKETPKPPERGIFALVEELAALARFQADPPSSAANIEVELYRLATGFASAIAPRGLGSLLANRDRLRNRLQSYLIRALLPDGVLMEHAKDRFLTLAGSQTRRLNRFLLRIPAARLRTYPDAELDGVIRCFLEWDPTLEFLETPGAADLAVDGWMTGFLERAAGVVAHARRLPMADAEDCVRDAVAAELIKLRRGDSKYIYEGSFEGWLIVAALNMAAGEARRHVPYHTATQSKPPAFSLDLLVEWRIRFLLVRAFFRPQVRPKVDEVWREMLLEADQSPEAAGAVVASSGLPLVRYRLRQRLEVLRFIRDAVPKGTPDLPGDRAMLSWVMAKRGYNPNDIVTLRHIAALARACCNQTLHWAVLARWIVDDRVDTPQAISEIRHLLSNAPVHEERLQRAAHYAYDRLGPVVLRAREDGVSIFVSPCWVRTELLDERDNAAILGVLLPEQREENGIRAICAGI